MRVFDIRSIKEWIVLRGHKKGICCTSYLVLQSPRANAPLTPSPNCPGTAHCASHSRLLWPWRRIPPLGSLLPTVGHSYTNFPTFSIIVRPRHRHFASIARRAAHARDISTSTANPPSRDALPGGQSKHPSAYIPPARPPARLHVKRTHDAFLGARATRQRCHRLYPSRPLSPGLLNLTTAGTAR
jgi:hypothetical protein